MTKQNEVEQVFRHCAYPLDQKPSKGEVVLTRGISGIQAFNPELLEKERPRILAWLSDLLGPFHEDSYSFTQFGIQRDGSVWTFSRAHMEMLLLLGLGLGVAHITLPESLWCLCPDGMPYISIKLPE